MDVVRTPDERFADLPGYPFAPHYVEIDGMRQHYVEEGPAGAAPILLLHGEPSWSYLYRKMVPILAAAGHRVIAPDLFGFGRSDKPVTREVYTYQQHVRWMEAFVRALDLREITIFGQDWGGLIGLRLAAEDPDRYARIVASNTFLPTGDRKPADVWWAFKEHMVSAPDVHIGGIVASGCRTRLSPEIIAAYDAPFPSEESKTAARMFPTIVPVSPDDPASDANRAAWKVLEAWDKPFLTLFGDSDPITAGYDAAFQKLVPGTAGQPHARIAGGGHFVQEDRGEELANAIVAWLA